MSDQSAQQTSQIIVVIPDEVRERHAELVDLIMKSESMNNEERQYWIDILLSMNEEQVGQLRSILINERDQLAAIDEKYATQIEATNLKSVEATHEERKKRRNELQSNENTARAEEQQHADDILKQME